MPERQDMPREGGAPSNGVVALNNSDDLESWFLMNIQACLQLLEAPALLFLPMRYGLLRGFHTEYQQYFNTSC